MTFRASKLIIIGIVMLLIFVVSVHAANISGLKYNDFNHNGHFDPINDIDPDDQELGLANWNISLYNESTGLLTTYQLTNSQGNFFFPGLDGNSVYTIKEDLASHPGWYNMTPTEVLVDFKNATVFPTESLASGASAQLILPTQNIAFAARSLWGNISSYHQDLEWENPFAVQSQTRTSINPHWINDTTYNFILTYDPSNLTSPINYTVTGPPSPSGALINYTTTSIYAAANLTGTTSPFDTIDIFTRANSGSTPARIEVTNLVLNNGSASYNIVNSSIADSTISPAQTHLIIRANEVLGPGANIATQGFTLTGQQKFIYPQPVPFIDPGGFAVQINVGKNNLTPTDQVVQFGNYQHIGEVEAHVYSDDNGNGIWDIVNNESQLEFWTVNLYYPNNTFIASSITDEDGEYEFQIPYGDYIVKEVPQSGWLQTQGKDGYSIEINNTSFYLTDENFGNQYQQIFNISGFKYNDINGNGKRDPGEPGLQGWIIGAVNASLSYYGTTITDATGNYSFVNVSKGIYSVNETLISGWHNTTFLNQTTCVPSFPFLPPEHLETIGGEVFYQAGGTPIGSDTAYLVTKITGTNPTMGYDVQNTEYPAWCGDTSTEIQTSKVYEIYSFIPSYPPFPPDFVSDFPTVATTPWDKINYMLNKRSYYYSLGNDSQTFQAAIWNFTNSRPIEAAYYPFGGVSLNAAQILKAKAIVADANANGAGYMPTCGGVEGIFLNIEQEDYGPVQLTFFEVPVRCCLPVNFGNQQLGTIIGYKNESVHGTGLAGWNITLTNSTTSFVSWNVTNNSGGYTFANIPYGTYWLNETPQAGYTQSMLTPNKTVIINGNNLTLFYNFTNTQQFGNITGNKVNGTGTGLSGWTIVLSNQTLGTFTNVTNSTGGYSFSNIPWGIYNLGEVNQTGWTQVTPNTTVEINGTSLLITNQNFTNTQQFGNITGNKVNGTGTGLSGWTIVLSNQTLGTFTNVTNSIGGYSFSNIPWGIYELGEVDQPGWIQNTPNTTVEINGTSLLITNQNFTNTQQSGNITGNKVNGTGTGLSGWTIVLTNQTIGTFTNVTNSTGGYSFSNIPWGIYELGEVDQPGWIQNSPNTTVEINGTSLLITNQNFTNTQQSGNITGNKVNGTGTGLSGWTIVLTNQTIGTFTNVTNSIGGYSFSNIPWGIYELGEVDQPGWIQNSPNTTVEINGTSLTLSNQNFTNMQQLGNVSGYKVNGTGTGLSGWTITLVNQTFSTPVFTNITDPAGTFNFTNIPWGLYWLNETPQVGWIQSPLTPNRTIEINGTSLVVTSQYFNNTQELGNVTGDKVNFTGAGLGGWTITLQNQSLGVPLFSNITDPSGNFAFPNIPWGLYWLNETPQAGWIQSPLTPNRTIEINGTSLLVTTQYFNNTQVLGNMSGYKVNGTGTGLSGWTIVLTNQTLGTFTNVTNSTGGYCFSNIPWGIYSLGEVNQPGWAQGTPNSTIQINGTSLTLVNQNFTNTQQLGNISGYKVNGTGTGLSGWTIVLTNQTLGTFTNVTNSTGGYCFSNIPWGVYSLGEVNQPGWAQGTPNTTVQINGTSLVIVNKNFTNTQQLGNISGYKRNSSGIGLNGWTIVLSNQTLGRFVNVTNNTGAYSFSNIPWGIYSLGEVNQPGWIQNTLNSTVEINGTSLILSGRNFTNTQQLGNISGYKRNSTGTGLSGWTITLSNGTILKTVTNSSGFFQFLNLPFGTYQLGEVQQTGWTQLTPNFTVVINASTSQLINQNFTNQQTPPQNVKWSGRGSVCTPRVNFAFQAQTQNGVTSGTVTFIDFTNGKTISGVVTSLVSSQNTATIGGTATVNGVPGYSFTLVVTRSPSSVFITIPGLSPSYGSGGSICSGLIDP